MIKGILKALAGKGVLIWLAGGWVVFYVTWAIWSKEAFAAFAMGLGQNPLIRVPFMVFLLSAFLNLLRVSRAVYKGAKTPAKGWVVFVLWVFLPAGVFLFMVGFFMSANFRQEARLLVSEGKIVRWQESVYRVQEIKAPLEEELLDVATEPGISSIFKYEPKIVLARGDERHEVGAFPPKSIDGTYYHILNFGLAPGIRLSREGAVLWEGYIALWVLPPGAVDGFKISRYPYRFSIKIVPEKIIEKGKTTARIYSLKSPAYEVTVRKGENVLFKGSSKDGVRFDSLALSFFKPSYWALLEVVKDPGRIVIILSLALIAVGIPLRVPLLICRVVRR